MDYSAGLADSSQRRTFLANVASLIRTTKGKSILLTSGARTALGIRGPYDGQAMLCMLGLSTDDARRAVSHNADIVQHRAKARLSVKAAVVVHRVAQGDVSLE